MVVAAAGLVLLVLSVFAEPIGLGDDDGFGSKQILGSVVGGAAVVAGLALVYAPRRGEVEPGPDH